jgi:hypothetical protein
MRDSEGETTVLSASVSAVSSDGKGKKKRNLYYWRYSSKQRHSKKTVVTLILRLSF